MLIESFIPNWDAVETHKIEIEASREAVGDPEKADRKMREHVRFGMEEVLRRWKRP